MEGLKKRPLRAVKDRLGIYFSKQIARTLDQSPRWFYPDLFFRKFFRAVIRGCFWSCFVVGVGDLRALSLSLCCYGMKC